MPWTAACGASPSRRPTRRRWSPISCWCRCWRSMPPGWRLGYGGGFYDRTLARPARAQALVAVGIAYDEQRVDAVPHLDYDERLDWVLTPSGPAHGAYGQPACDCLFLGDVVGRTGRQVVVDQLPQLRAALQARFRGGQRRELGRRLRHHGDHLRGPARRRRRRRDARQPRLRPEGGAGVHRAPAAAAAPDQLSAGTPGKGAGLFKAATAPTCWSSTPWA